jgi:hypothetical protein
MKLNNRMKAKQLSRMNKYEYETTEKILNNNR